MIGVKEVNMPVSESENKVLIELRKSAMYLQKLEEMQARLCMEAEVENCETDFMTILQMLKESIRHMEELKYKGNVGESK
jgi:hypothetical protein